jgi:hypothetical protein
MDGLITNFSVSSVGGIASGQAILSVLGATPKAPWTNLVLAQCAQPA